ncbi:unnamed protein product, partial [Iphiclides podalirius]
MVILQSARRCRSAEPLCQPTPTHPRHLASRAATISQVAKSNTHWLIVAALLAKCRGCVGVGWQSGSAERQRRALCRITIRSSIPHSRTGDGATAFAQRLLHLVCRSSAMQQNSTAYVANRRIQSARRCRSAEPLCQPPPTHPRHLASRAATISQWVLDLATLAKSMGEK